MTILVLVDSYPFFIGCDVDFKSLLAIAVDGKWTEESLLVETRLQGLIVENVTMGIYLQHFVISGALGVIMQKTNLGMGVVSRELVRLFNCIGIHRLLHKQSGYLINSTNMI